MTELAYPINMINTNIETKIHQFDINNNIMSKQMVSEADSNIIQQDRKLMGAQNAPPTDWPGGGGRATNGLSRGGGWGANIVNVWSKFSSFFKNHLKSTGLVLFRNKKLSVGVGTS